MRVLTAALFLMFVVQAAHAGAWTLEHGKIHTFTSFTSSRASDRFDGRGAPSGKAVFKKLLVKTWMEYGLTDAVTLYCAPEYVLAETGDSEAGVTHFQSSSVEAGGRILLLSRIGMLAVQLSAKSAGAFDMSISASGEAGSQFELRMLYGKSYKLLGRDAFFDLEAAERWISRPRPDELAIDATLGVWLDKRNLVMLQSFNAISNSGEKPPYNSYRLHKLQASWVLRVTRRWSIEGGYFFALAGQNMVREQGFVTQVWFQT